LSLLLTLHSPLLSRSRKEKQQAAIENPTAAKKRKGPAAKKAAVKKAKVENDAAVAKALAEKRESVRDRDSKGVKSKKAAALAALREERKVQRERVEESDDSDLDFGDDDDSDDDYEEAMPWQQKNKMTSKSTTSRLDKLDDSGDDMEIDNDDDDEKEVRTRVPKRNDENARPAVIEANLDDFTRCTIPRRRLARWCNEPFFKAAVLECYVRLFIGENENGEKTYRLCEIVDVVDGAVTYKFPVARKGDIPVSTNKYLRLKFGKNEKEFPMYIVSDEAPKEKDLRTYMTNQRNNRLEVLSRRRAHKLRRVQDHLVSTYTYTKEDIERNLEARKKQGNVATNLGSRQTLSALAVQAAKDAVADAEQRLAEAKKAFTEAEGFEEKQLEKSVAEAEISLQKAKEDLEQREYEEKAILAAVEARKRRFAKRSRDVDWTKVNQKALKLNQEADRKAGKIKENLASVPGGKVEDFNPYARRRAKPKILWKVGQDAEDRADKNEKNEELRSPDTDPVASEGTRTIQAGSDTPNLIQEDLQPYTDSHQFIIDEEDLAQSSSLFGRNGNSSLSRQGKGVQRIRRGLSLTDYLERKAKGTL
jgi:RNA polymerase-associated protein RTF1